MANQALLEAYLRQQLRRRGDDTGEMDYRFKEELFGAPSMMGEEWRNYSQGAGGAMVGNYASSPELGYGAAFDTPVRPPGMDFGLEIGDPTFELDVPPVEIDLAAPAETTAPLEILIEAEKRRKRKPDEVDMGAMAGFDVGSLL